MNSAQHNKKKENDKKSRNNTKKSCCLAEKPENRAIGAARFSQNLALSSKPAQQPVKKENNNSKQSFAEKIYSALRKVPKGKVTTYKDLANACGTNAFRAVGTAMRNNPYAPQVPCHRVVSSDGRIGGFMGETKGVAIDKKIAMLKKEGVIIVDNKVRDFDKIRHKF